MIRAIVMPLKSQMPFLLGRCQTLPQVRPTSSILRWFGRDAAVPYPHGRMAKDNQLEGNTFYASDSGVPLDRAALSAATFDSSPSCPRLQAGETPHLG